MAWSGHLRRPDHRPDHPHLPEVLRGPRRAADHRHLLPRHGDRGVCRGAPLHPPRPGPGRAERHRHGGLDQLELHHLAQPRVPHADGAPAGAVRAHRRPAHVEDDGGLTRRRTQ